MRILVVGAGDIGKPIIKYLSDRANIMTVIDKDEEECKMVSNQSDAEIFNGNGCNLEIWKSFEADKIDMLLALSNDDIANINICDIAKKKFGIPIIIARAEQPKNIIKMKKAGANDVICPSQETLYLFLNAIERLKLETLYLDPHHDYKIVKVVIPENGSIIGKNLKYLDLSDDCKVISVFRNSQLIYPEKSYIFKRNDKVLLSGSSELIEKNVEKMIEIEIT